MNIRLHEVPEGLIDAAVGLEAAQSVQGRGGYAEAEMAAAVAGAGVPAVEVAFVDDLAGRGVQRGLESLADQGDALGGHGSTCTNGRTSTRVQAPAVR